MDRWLTIAFRAALLWLALLTQVGANPLYESGRTAWLGGEYPKARKDLLDFRKELYGRRPDVDFMLGTSGCRIAMHRVWGHDVLDWMLYAYALTYESRQLVAHERDLCREATSAQQVETRLDQIVEERAAGMTGYGKTFYWAQRDQQPVGSYPIRRNKAMAKEVFLARLVKTGDGQRAESNVRSRLPDARVLVTDQIVLASIGGHSESELESIGQTLNRYLRFLAAEYDIEPPPHYLTVYLVKDFNEVRDLADKLHGLDVSRATVGYAFVDDASIVGAVPGTAAGTILHEMFHLMARARFGDIPQWMDEGMAALYEVSGRNGDHYFGLPNWRGKVLEELWGMRPSIDELIRTEWFLFDDPAQARAAEPDRPAEMYFDRTEGMRQAAMMATARYFAMYLEQNGKLQPTYRAMRDRGFAQLNGDARAHAVKLVEEVVGKPVADIDREFANWFRSGGAQQPASTRRLITAGGTRYVANANVNVRTGPATDYEKLTMLRRGESVAVFAEANGWFEVRFSDGTAGFIFGRYLDISPGSE